MELTALQQLVHQMYIAYYQRPADPEGLQYWVEQLEQNGDWSTVSAAFGAPENTENQALYGDLTREETIAAIYQSAFNRAAVEAEVQFWAASEFTATDLTFAIVNGAQNDDLATVNNKVEFSALLVQQVETNAAFAQLEDPKALLAAVTAETTVNAEYVSNAVASGTTGETFSLTADGAGEVFVGTANNDTFNAESGALASNTTIDGQGGNDTLNATYKTVDFTATPITRNVENINVNIDAFDGTATTFNATNVRGSTITLSSTKLGFNGTAGVQNTAANNVAAGENVDTLTVTGLTTGNVNAGSADTVNVTTVATTDMANVTVNGDVALNVTNATELSVEATEDSVVTLTGSATSITGSGAGALTVSGDLNAVTEISGVETAEITNVSVTNASEWNVTTVAVDADMTGALTVADDANVSISTTQGTALAVTGQGNTGSTVNVTSGLASVGSLTFASLANANVNLTAAASVATLVTGGADTTVNVAGDTTIATLTATGDDVIFTGEGDVTVTAATNAASVDASGLTGALDLDSSLTTAVSISGGSGDNEVDLAATAANETATYVGQSGNDTVTSTAQAGNVEATFAGGNNSLTANALNAGTLSVAGGAGNETISATGLTTGTVAGNLGGGDDTLTLGDSTVLDGTNATTIAVDFGAGNDTLVLGASANLTAASFNVVGLENITVNTAATFTGSQLTGDSYNIAGTTAGADLFVNATSAAGETIDLSGIMLSNIAGSNVALTLTGLAGNDTLTGTNRADTIDGGAGADSMTGGAGNDTFVIANGAVATANDANVVTDFSNGSNTLDFAGVAGSGTNYTEASAAVADYATARTAAEAAIDGTTVLYNAQQVGADTYVFYSADGTLDGTGDAVVKLTGVALDGIEFADIVA